MVLPAGLVATLSGIVGSAHVLTESDTMASFTTDWTGRFSGASPAVVRPATTAEVAGVLRACKDSGVPVVPQGGNTGLVGGGVPRAGEVVLSLRRLDTVAPVDTLSSSVQVGAGATLAAVQSIARPHHLAVGVDLASRDSATIGGMVATNAGGIRVVAHGSMRRQVIGIEAVTAQGSVVRRLPGLAKDNSGYDLPSLLAGSEGTLAVITGVNLALVPIPTATTVLLVDCADIADALDVVAQARRHGRLLAVEVMRQRGLALVCAHLGVSRPLPIATPDPATLLIEFEGPPDTATLPQLIADRPATIGQDAADNARLWRYRESHTEAINARGVPAKLDVTVPLGRMAAFVARLDGLVPSAITFGHLADGNVHVNLLESDRQAEEDVLRLVADHDGSISSEHGIGVAKAKFLGMTRSPQDIAVMRSIKDALDPDGILNPGVILSQTRPAASLRAPLAGGC